MADYADQTLSGDVELDGSTFRNCAFKDAQVLYRGGAAPAFDNCTFDRTYFTFADEAANTLNFLRSMAPAQSNMRQIVLGLMPELAPGQA